MISAGHLEFLGLDGNIINENDLSMPTFPWKTENSAYTGIKRVAQMLLKNTVLTHLNLARNSLGDIGANVLGTGLVRLNDTIRT